MTSVQGVNAFNNKPLLRASNTGYAALIGLGLTTTSAISKNKSIQKTHKPLAYITAGLTLLHSGTILYQRHEWKKQQKEFNA